MGLHVAAQIVRRHLDPSSPLVDFSRPSTALKGEKRSASASASVRRPQPVPAELLPKFILPKTTYMRLPGDLVLVRSRLPKLSTIETVDMATGEVGSDSVTSVKVPFFIFI